MRDRSRWRSSADPPLLPAEEVGSGQSFLRHGATTAVITADVSETSSAEQLYSQVQDRGIQIDLLINNAGFNVYGPFIETDLGNEARMLQVNLVSVIALTKLFARDMVRRGFGKILNLGSTGSFAPAPLDSLYAASKAFVLSFFEAGPRNEKARACR